MSATLGSTGTPPPPPGGGSGAPPFGDAVYEMSVEPSGNDGPELKAKLEQRASRVDFNVELEDLAAGTYGLVIGGTNQGSIVVRAVPGGTEGELEFRNPVESGHELLDFDPRGKFIDITSASGIVMTGVFPGTPTGTASGGDSGGDDNGDDDNGGDDSDDDNGGHGGGDDDDDDDNSGGGG